MRPIVELIRLEENFEYGTFGVLKIQKRVFCATLEPPDIENMRNVSSVPAQQYKCKRYMSPKFGETFQVTDVPLRAKILFHAGNTIDQTLGCILLGRNFGVLEGNRAVLNSGNTFKAFMKRMEGHLSFHLTIKEVY
jgi:hypothetical protein